VHFRRRQLARCADRQPLQRQRSDLHPFQLAHRVAEPCQHAAQLPVAALAQRDEQHRAVVPPVDNFNF
jgi:hypothetical protein